MSVEAISIVVIILAGILIIDVAFEHLRGKGRDQDVERDRRVIRNALRRGYEDDDRR